MFLTRLCSSVLLLAVMVTSIVMGGPLLLCLAGFISFMGLFELYRVMKMEKSVLAFFGYGGTLLLYILLFFNKSAYILPLVIAVLLAQLFLYVFSFPSVPCTKIFGAFFGMVYVALMLSFIYQTRTLENGAWITGLIFVGAWGSDTCAYCVGKLIGKHKVTPKLSPKKSLEGCIGGVLGAALIAVLYSALMGRYVELPEYGYFIFAFIGAAASVISQLGDLAASGIKREYDIKDYGKLIPGHGGIMDRFDSIITTAPVVFYMAVFFL